MNIVALQLSPIFRPKLGNEQKKRSSLKFSSILRPKLGEEQKKKGLHSNLVRDCSAGQEQTTSPTICVLQASAQLTKGGREHSTILHTNLC